MVLNIQTGDIPDFFQDTAAVREKQIIFEISISRKRCTSIS